MNSDQLKKLGITRHLIRSLEIESKDGRGVRVVVVDSGITQGHPHVGQLVRGVRIQEDPESGFLVEEDLTDASGHGTACAGVIRSIAPGCEIASVKILDAHLAASGDLLSRAIFWAVEEGRADVINLSLGTRKEESIPSLRAACDAAEQECAVIVAAAQDNRGIDYPAGFPNVLGVTVSGNGGFYVSPDRPDLFYAPDYPLPIPGQKRQDNFSGSSFAAARITGLTALIVGAHRADTPIQLMDHLNGSLPPFEYQS